MLQFPAWKRALVIGTVLLGLLFCLPNFLGEGGRSSLPGFLPSETLKLGLDLKGGSYLLLEVEPEELEQNELRQLSRDIQRELIKRPGNVRFRNREVIDGAVRFRVVEPTQTDEAINRVKSLSDSVGVGGPQSLSVTEQGGVVTVRFSDARMRQLEEQALKDSIEVVRRRVDGSGTTDPNIQRQGSNRIVLEVPGLDDPKELIDLIQRAGVMTVNMVDEQADPANYDLDVARLGKIKRVETSEPFREFVLHEDPILTGSDFATAAQAFDERGLPQISFTLKTRGAKIFGETTAANVGRSFAIVLDGQIISVATIQSPILGGSGRITGSFTIEEANAIAIVLRAGELPAKLKVVEQRVVGAGLGEDSIRAGAIASILGLILVAIFMVLAYGLWGSFAVASLAANIMLIIGALSGLGATLTLPGIAGIILTIGMAVDANVLVFERVREEARGGRSPITSIEVGYQQATSTIFDANITTMIAAAVLFQLGSGPVKGFAVTLAIGVLTSVFTAFVLTRMFMSDWLKMARPKKLPV